MREKKELLDFVESSRDESFVLITLEDTEGSTYRKKGAQKIVSETGDHRGLISGGCLDGFIRDHALAFLEGTAEDSLCLDTTKDTDRLFGSNIGCRGKLYLSLKKLSKKELLSESYLGIKAEETLKVLVFGAGPDIDPLYELLLWNRWDLQVFSNSKELVDERREQGWNIQQITSVNDANSLDRYVENPNRTAVILMSHNYPFDLEVLNELLKMNLGFIGLLGPLKRKQQLFEDLKKIYSANLDTSLDHVHGPVGLSGFGRGESAIALSIVSQLQQHFFGDKKKI